MTIDDICASVMRHCGEREGPRVVEAIRLSAQHDEMQAAYDARRANWTTTLETDYATD